MDKDSDYKTLIKENETRIKSITRYYSRSKDDYDDLYQEILINIWKSISNFRGDSSMKTYVYRVALNTAITFANKESKRLSFRVDWDVDKFDSFLIEESDELVITTEMENKLQTELNNLTIIDRTIVILTFENVSSKEISQIIGISEPNVRVKIHRIKNDLRKKLNGAENEH